MTKTTAAPRGTARQRHRVRLRSDAHSDRPRPPRSTRPVSPPERAAIIAAFKATGTVKGAARRTGFNSQTVSKTLRSAKVIPPDGLPKQPRAVDQPAEVARVVAAYERYRSLTWTVAATGFERGKVRRIVRAAGIMQAPGAPGRRRTLHSTHEPLSLPQETVAPLCEAEQAKREQRERERQVQDHLADLRRVYGPDPSVVPALREIELRRTRIDHNRFTAPPPRDVTALVFGDPEPGPRFAPPSPAPRFPGVTLARLSV